HSSGAAGTVGYLVAILALARYPARHLVRLLRRSISCSSAPEVSSLLAYQLSGKANPLQRIPYEPRQSWSLYGRVAEPASSVAAWLSFTTCPHRLAYDRHWIRPRLSTAMGDRRCREPPPSPGNSYRSSI